MPTGSPDPTHCAGCGQSTGDCAGCLPPLDPPRFCGSCGGRLRVQVTPAGWTSHCRRCAAAAAAT